MLDDLDLQRWFRSDVLPLEPVLMRFIRRHWRSAVDHKDIRQDVYERTLVGAGRSIPIKTKAYLLTVARNVMINRARRERIVSIELIADLETSIIEPDWLTPERHAGGRDELRRAQAGLDRLPPRCREVIKLRKVEGLSTREVAEHLGIGIDAVQQQTTFGIRALADYMLGGTGHVKRPRRGQGLRKHQVTSSDWT
ncbi:RNA polymerase sigma factor [Sphingobium sp.]|uniref:RNA polymerase sigma factor n=1 Tax=Sphingobium sp. TaxID=1912891 RepID=UPI002C84314C|nr:RNA polymerase sigma factor [Sphingobium sp.]HUD93612.1 RNA polymerase sigma factor [Sphingobium sp.]